MKLIISLIILVVLGIFTTVRFGINSGKIILFEDTNVENIWGFLVRTSMDFLRSQVNR